jgi:hypothetical protein
VPATALWESKVGIMTCGGGGGKPEGHGEHKYLKLHSLESKLGTLTSGRKPRGLELYVPVIAFAKKIPEMLTKGTQT